MIASHKLFLVVAATSSLLGCGAWPDGYWNAREGGPGKVSAMELPSMDLNHEPDPYQGTALTLSYRAVKMR
jgi:hypothetical protein